MSIIIRTILSYFIAQNTPTRKLPINSYTDDDGLCSISLLWDASELNLLLRKERICYDEHMEESWVESVDDRIVAQFNHDEMREIESDVIKFYKEFKEAHLEPQGDLPF